MLSPVLFTFISISWIFTAANHLNITKITSSWILVVVHRDVFDLWFSVHGRVLTIPYQFIGCIWRSFPLLPMQCGVISPLFALSSHNEQIVKLLALAWLTSSDFPHTKVTNVTKCGVFHTGYEFPVPPIHSKTSSPQCPAVSCLPKT